MPEPFSDAEDEEAIVQWLIEKMRRKLAYRMGNAEWLEQPNPEPSARDARLIGIAGSRLILEVFAKDKQDRPRRKWGNV